ncbi:hypothetical protein RAJCM14343_5109 [Rhodococcus aetherivorans]|uniref:Uncharacterized protein n=1 Tax=Rhodococcus aetherivorans TaxID=191292 RepID=A0ABQ0YT62_9NOCA|nr:hypothetical protein RAJCM14343_5109 [Rhodococcus aetherivorans]
MAREDAGEPVGPGVELTVGDGAAFEGQGDRLRHDRRHRRQQFGPQLRGDRGPAPRRGQGGELTRGDDLHVPHRHGRIRGDRVEDPHEPVRERGDRVRVEQVGGVGERRPHAGSAAGPLGDRQLQVERRQAGIEVEHPRRRPRQRDLGALDVLELEQHLEQRGVGRRPGRVEGLDEPLERDVGLAERRQVRRTDPPQQGVEPFAFVHPGPQHHGVDEHADQIVEGAVTAPGDGGADHDVVAGGQPGQQHRQRRMHDHEQRRVVLAGQREHAAVGVGVDLERHAGTAPGLLHRAGPVPRQLEQFRRPGQRVVPERELPGGGGGGIGLVAQHGVLPQCVVGVLHRQRRPVGGVTTGAGGVRGHQIPAQRSHREPVGGDMVHDQDQHVVGVGEGEQPDPHRHLGGDVEPGADDPVDVRGHRVLGLDAGDGEVGLRHRDRQHDLDRAVVGERVAGAQRLVARGDVGGSGPQRREIQLPGQTQRDGDVVGRGGRVELVDEPHALLGRGQRDRGGPGRGGGQRGPRRGIAVAEPLGEGGDGGRVEQITHAHVGAGRRGDPRGQPHGQQRVAAQIQEAVVHAETLHPEQAGEDLGQDLLDRGARRDVLRRTHGREVRGGQCLAVELAVGVEREPVEDDDVGGHHVAGQPGRGGPEQGRGIECAARRGIGCTARRGIAVPAGFGHDVRDEHPVGAVGGAGGVPVHHDRGLRDGRVGEQRLLDLTELDPQAPELDLEIGAAQVDQIAVAAPGHEVAGAVHAGAGRTERIGDEPVGGQVAAPDIAAGELDAGQVQLPHGADGNRVQPRIEDVDAGVPHRGADRDDVDVVVGAGPECDVDGGLGGPVQVVQVRGGERGVGGGDRGRGQRLAAAEQQPQRRAAGRVGGGDEHREHGRHEVRHGDVLLLDDGGEVGGIAVPVGCGDDEARPGLQRPEELPHRHVERERCLLQDGVLGGERVGVLHPPQPVDDRGVSDRDALGPAGGAGGVQHVGEVVPRQRGGALLRGDGGVGGAGPVEAIDLEDRGRGGQRRPVGGGGEHAHRTGVAQNVFEPVGGVVGVERQVGAAGLDHRVHPDEQLDRAAHREPDEAVRADALGDQPPGEPVGAGIELGVGQGLVAEDDGDGVGGAGRLPGEQVGEGVRAAGGVGGVPAPQDQLAFARLEQVEVADGHVRGGGHGGEQPHEAVGEGGDGAGVEQVGRVGQGAGEGGGGAVVAGDLGQHQVQVEFGGAGVDFGDVDGQVGQPQVGGLGVLEGQHHLEQGRVGLGSVVGDGVDEGVERQVGVGEGVDVAVADVGQVLGEGVLCGDGGAQDDGVDEHADQIVEGAVAATGDRGADGDVVAAREPGQQHRQGRVHRDERGGAVRAGQVADRPVQFGADLEADGGAAERLLRRAGPVGGQRQHFRCAGKGFAPVPQLGGGERIRVGRIAEDLPLPQRVVGVLHLQGRPVGGAAAGAGGVRGHQIPGQRRHRRPVRRDVMHHEHQHVLPVAEREQPRPHRHLHRHVEPGRDLGGQTLRQLVGGDGRRGEIEAHLLDRADPLDGTVGRGRELGAQRLVAGEHIGDGGGERVPVEPAAQPDRHRDVVGRRGGVELVDEPHPLLGRGDRQHPRTGPGDQRHPGARADVGGEGGEGPHRGGLEQCPDPQVGAEGGVDAGDDTGGDQRVSAEVEEAVVETDAVDAEELGEHLRHRPLGVGGRRDVGGAVHREHGHGQGAAVELADRGERDLVEDDDRRGHHVRRQAPRQVRGEGGGFGGASGRGQHVGHQHGVAGRGGVPDRHRERDVLVGGQDRVDLAEFDAEAADLDLEVGPAEVFEGAVAPPAHHVAGAVHPLPRCPERVGDEPAGAEPGLAAVAAGDARAGNVQLAGDADRHRPQPGVQDDLVRAAHGGADRDRGGRRERTADVDDDRALGRAVRVEHPPAPGPAGDEFGRARVAGDGDRLGGDALRIDGGQRRGGGEGVGDALLAEEAGQFLAAVDRRGHHDEGGADRERGHVLVHRGVEARGREVRDPRVRGGAVPAVQFGAQVRQPAVRHHHALRAAGGPGGVDQVGGMVEMQRAVTVEVRQRPVGDRVQRRDELRVVEHQPRHVGGQAVAVGGGGHAEDGSGVGEHVLDPLGRVGGVDRHVRGAGLGHRPDRGHGFEGPGDAEGNERLRAGAGVDQHPGDPVGPGVELPVRHRAALEFQGRRVGHVRGHGGEDLGPQLRGRAGQSADRAQLRGFVGEDDVDVPDRCRRVGGDGVEDPQQTFAERSRRIGVEEVGGVRTPQAGALGAGRGVHRDFGVCEEPAAPGGLAAVEQHRQDRHVLPVEGSGEPVRRHVGVGGRGGVYRRDPAEERGERLALVELHPQRQRPGGAGDADESVGAGGEPADEHRDGGVQ